MPEFVENLKGEKFYVGDIINFSVSCRYKNEVIKEIDDRSMIRMVDDAHGAGCHWYPANLVLIERPAPVQMGGWEEP